MSRRSPTLMPIVLALALAGAAAGRADDTPSAGNAASAGASPVVVGGPTSEADAPTAAAPAAANAPGEVNGPGEVNAPNAPNARGNPMPMHAEIQESLDNERAQLARLQANLQRASDPKAALEIEQQIEAVKLQTQVTVLQIQARHARRAGQSAAADQMEAAIARITAPPQAGNPTVRPRPEPSPVQK